jgi:hypothetical protein
MLSAELKALTMHISELICFPAKNAGLHKKQAAIHFLENYTARSRSGH